MDLQNRRSWHSRPQAAFTILTHPQTPALAGASVGTRKVIRLWITVRVNFTFFKVCFRLQIYKTKRPTRNMPAACVQPLYRKTRHLSIKLHIKAKLIPQIRLGGNFGRNSQGDTTLGYRSCKIGLNKTAGRIRQEVDSNH